MREGQLLMTQADRDRLVALKKVKKKLVTQREAAEELRLSIRQVQRLKVYQIERQAVTTGLRGADVRIEKRLDGSLAVRYGERYLPVKECAVVEKPKAGRPAKAAKTPRKGGRGSDWNRNFDLKKAPKVWQAAQGSGHRRGEAV